MYPLNLPLQQQKIKNVTTNINSYKNWSVDSGLSSDFKEEEVVLIFK